jgi:hypothetical protein
MRRTDIQQMRPPGTTRKGSPNRKRPVPEGAPLPLRQLLELQNQHKLTDRELAKRAGYAESLVPQWRNEHAVPGIVTLSEFADVFNYELRLVPKEKT